MDYKYIQLGDDTIDVYWFCWKYWLMMSSVKRNVYYSVSTVDKFTVYTLYTPTPTHTPPTHTPTPTRRSPLLSVYLGNPNCFIFVRTLLT